MLTRPKPKRHCKDDQACGHCCSCALQYKQQFRVREKTLTQSNNKLQEEAKKINNANLVLVKELETLRKKKKELDSLDQVKEKIREQLLRQIEDNKSIQEIMKDEKIKTLVEDNKILEGKVSSLHQKIERLEYEIQRLNSDLSYFEELKTQNRGLKEKLQEKSTQLQHLIHANMSQEKQISNKTKCISRLQTVIGDLEGKYNLERSKANDYELTTKTLEMNIKSREEYISTLTKVNENNAKSISSLQNNNNRLRTMIGNMDIENAAFRINEEYLKDRIIESENVAAFSSHKVERMKDDLYALKLAM